MDKHELIGYADSLMRTAVKLCHSVDDAQDLVQDTMLAALQALQRGMKIDDASAWLNRTLRCRFYDKLRQKYRKPTVSYDILPQEMPDVFDPSEWIIREEDAREVRQALAFESQLYREVLVRYYMKGQNAGKIARALSLPKGTVTRRLDTGRKHIRERVEHMEHYTKQSYEPDTLYLSCSGSGGLNEEPFSLVGGDKLAQNVLILAYEKPMTEEELSRAMGVPAAYLEPVVDKLVQGELVKRMPGGKVYTDFILFTEHDRTVTGPMQQSIARENFEALWQSVEEGLRKLREAEYYQCQNEHQRSKLEAFFAVHALLSAEVDARNSVCEGGQIPFADYPDRPNGGKWYALGNIYPAGYEWGSNPYGRYSISGRYGVCLEKYHGAKYVELQQYDTLLGEARYGIPADKLLGLLYAVYSGEDATVSGVEPVCFDQVPDLKQKGFLSDNGVLQVDLPVLTQAQWQALLSCASDVTGKVAPVMKNALAPLWKLGKVCTPAHLTSVPDFQRYMFCSAAVVMMIISEAKERGRFLRGVDYPCPAVIFLVEQ